MRSCCSNPAGTTLPLASCGTIGPVVGVAPVRPTSAEHSRWRVAWTWCVRLKVEIAWIRGNLHFDSRAHAGAYLFDFIEVVDNPPPDPPRAPHPS